MTMESEKYPALTRRRDSRGSSRAYHPRHASRSRAATAPPAGPRPAERPAAQGRPALASAGDLAEVAGRLTPADVAFLARLILLVAEQNGSQGEAWTSWADGYREVAAAQDAAQQVQPVAVWIEPAAGAPPHAVAAVADAVGRAPGFDVLLRSARSGLVRLDGAVSDPAGLAQWIAGQPGVLGVRFDLDAVRVVAASAP